LQFVHVILRLEKAVNPLIDIKYTTRKSSHYYSHFR
jgi:hypothetical protein